MKEIATLIFICILILNTSGQNNSISVNAKIATITHQNELVNFHVYEKSGVFIPELFYYYRTETWKTVLRVNYYSVQLAPINNIESLNRNTVKTKHLDFTAGYYRNQQFQKWSKISLQYGLEYLYQRNSHIYDVVNTQKIVNKQYHQYKYSIWGALSPAGLVKFNLTDKIDLNISGKVSLLSLIKTPSGNPRLISRELYLGSFKNLFDYNFYIDMEYLITEQIKFGLGYQQHFQQFKLPYPFRTLERSFTIQLTYSF